MSKIAKWFNKVSQKLGSALQNQESAEGTPVEETPKVVEATQSVGEEMVETSTQSSQPVEKESAPQTQNEQPKLESRSALIYSVIDTLSKLIDNKSDTAGKRIVVWLDCDYLTFNQYDNEAYRNQMLSALVNERGFKFEKVAFHIGKPAAELHATPIRNYEMEYLQVESIDGAPAAVSCKATITIFGNAGSMLQEQYILSSDEMKKKAIPVYNIGAGQFPVTPEGYRENHIAIDDNPHSPMVEKNKYVSRMHAHIGFSENVGFYLQVELDGTRLMGKRTRIFRGEEKIECDNPRAKVPLQNGDLIELGKAVVLRFMQCNEE